MSNDATLLARALRTILTNQVAIMHVLGRRSKADKEFLALRRPVTISIGKELSAVINQKDGQNGETQTDTHPTNLGSND